MDNIGVLIPSDRIARVIGKAGFGLKQIREITGVKVTVQESSGAEAEAEADPVPRRVDISGNAEQMAMAFALVVNKAYASGGPQTIDQQLLVPQDKAGSVVGKGGENLRRVREECRVRLSLDRDPVENAEKGIQERMVTMSGDAENMRHAIWYVLGLGCGPFAMMGGFGMMPGSPLALTAAGMSHVQPPGADPEEVQVHMHVPEHLAGAILGKAGAQVKQTAAVAGCKVSVSARDVGAERRAAMIGSFGQVSTAQKIVAEQLSEAAAAAGSEMREVSVVLMVRKEAAGVVIGKQGASLTQIREKTGARIQLAREEVMGQRTCNISGPIASILQAEELIFELVRQVPVAPQAPQPFGMGGFPGFGQDMPGMGPDGRPGTGNPEEVTKLLVPAASAGSVIGKQGSGLKQIREMCGVHVDVVQSAPDWPNDRVVTVKGTLTSRQQAVEMITRMAYQMSGDSSTLKLLVPAPQVGGVIGKQGSTLRAIREQCGVSTQVEREEVDGDRMVSVTGHHPQVAAAGRSILSVLAGAGPGGGGGSRPDSGPQGAAGGRGGPRQGQPQQGQQQGRQGQQRPPQQQQQQQQRPAPQRQMQQPQMQQPQMQQQQQQHPQLQQQQQQQQRQQQMQPQLQPGYGAALQQQMLQPQQQRPQQLQQLQQYPFHPQPPSNIGYAAPAGYTMGPTPWG